MMHRRFDPARTAACVIVKHPIPCGVAEGRDLVSLTARRSPATPSRLWRHHRRQPRAPDADTARVITEILTEVIIAPVRPRRPSAIIAEAAHLRLLLAGSLPIPRAAGLTAKNRRRWLAGARAATIGGRRHRAQDGDEAGA